ncbi:hypothetical protein BD626DRAFT_564880 [Schizophyllum amplum]|uniref:Uncharacterized protein n=1 Tax=Schizophyllum amplum TaxID=97359 RepID=A0A550CT86_9AGAR|nr:hypothetical protein BD626DRAFT_564880 [Auriculariopsis ampla]
MPSMSPQGKATKDTELMEQQKGSVGMVGDGIYNSPALVVVDIARSHHVSPSPSRPSDVVLVRNDLLDAVAAFTLRATYTLSSSVSFHPLRYKPPPHPREVHAPNFTLAFSESSRAP